uniref:VOC family protein n=1 Tax=Lachnospira sp. TaxID=2049031 RepID=UPI003FEF7A01
MRLKNILIIVDKLEESVRFYKDLFGLQVILKQEGNVILSEGLVLQDVNVWYESTQIPTTFHSNMTELYFEENDMECFIKKLESYDFCLNYVNKLTKLEGGQKLVRFYDPSGNLIEVRTPVNYN